MLASAGLPRQIESRGRTHGISRPLSQTEPGSAQHVHRLFPGMDGEWGVGGARTFETLPAEGRGFFSGVLQEGYVVGYLLASLVYGTLFPIVGWRGMFVIGALPAFLVIYIRTKVDESPAWLQGQVSRTAESHVGKDIWSHAGIFLFLVVVVLAFNSSSQGTQDVHPTFLQTAPQCTQT